MLHTAFSMISDYILFLSTELPAVHPPGCLPALHPYPGKLITVEPLEEGSAPHLVAHHHGSSRTHELPAVLHLHSPLGAGSPGDLSMPPQVLVGRGRWKICGKWKSVFSGKSESSFSGVIKGLLGLEGCKSEALDSSLPLIVLILLLFLYCFFVYKMGVTLA
jgi:hypothetical protein